MELTIALEKRDISKINALNKLTDLRKFWTNVRKLTKNVHSDHALKRWQILAEIRYKELQNSITKEQVRNRIINSCDKSNGVYKGELFADSESIDYIPNLVYQIEKLAPDYDLEDFELYLQIGLVDKLCEQYPHSTCDDMTFDRIYLDEVKKELLTCLEFCTRFRHA